MKSNQYIEIVTSPIGALNLMPQKVLDSVKQVLTKHYAKVEISVIHNEDELNKIVTSNPDLVVSGIKYLGFNEYAIKRNSQDKIWFSEFLDNNNIRYMGSSRAALELEFDKSKAKRTVANAGIRTAESFIAIPDQFGADQLLVDYPLFIKPLFEGNSRGVDARSLVHNFKEYEEKVLSIHENQHTQSLVEKYLSGKEYTVGVIQDFANNTYQINPVELIAEMNTDDIRILSFDDKVTDNELVLEIDNETVKSLVSELAMQAFKAIGAKGYGRIDIKMDENGIPHFLEANLVPGLGYGYFYRCYKLNGGVSYEQMLLDIVGHSLH